MASLRRGSTVFEQAPLLNTDLTVHIHRVPRSQPSPHTIALFKSVFRHNVIAEVSYMSPKVTVYELHELHELHEKSQVVSAVVTTTHDGVPVIRYAATVREERGRGMMRALLNFMRTVHETIGVCSHKNEHPFWIKCGFRDKESHLAFSNSKYMISFLGQ